MGAELSVELLWLMILYILLALADQNRRKHHPDLSFEDVTFAYPTRPDATVLRDFSLSVNAGEMVAVVGGSGSGKSTLIALLTALYSLEHATNSGAVRFGGHNVDTLDHTWLRGQIGVVTQCVCC